jgi:hypothetical protein
MPHFKKQIKTDQGIQEFSFNRIATVGGTHYYISVVNKNNITRLFQMEYKIGVWAFRDISKVPEWVIPLESKLADAIDEH